MATKKDILDRKKEVTDKISTQVRTIAAGLIVFTWSVYSSTEHGMASAMKSVLTPLLLVIDLLCVFALSADFLQYMSSWLTTDKALKDSENISQDDYTYDDEWISY